MGFLLKTIDPVIGQKGPSLKFSDFFQDLEKEVSSVF